MCHGGHFDVRQRHCYIKAQGRDEYLRHFVNIVLPAA
jgi:hypothetical protein